MKEYMVYIYPNTLIYRFPAENEEAALDKAWAQAYTETNVAMLQYAEHEVEEVA